jgi:hypothetical protein
MVSACNLLRGLFLTTTIAAAAYQVRNLPRRRSAQSANRRDRILLGLQPSLTQEDPRCASRLPWK